MRLLAYRTSRLQAGYSLIGICLFIVVLGILTVAGLGLKQQYDWANRQEFTVHNQQAIKDALNRFQGIHGRLPCPAPLNDQTSSATFGKETDCSGAVASGTFQDTGRGGRKIRYGAIPVRTLDLSDEAIADGWGHRVVYAVTEYYAAGLPDHDFDYGAIEIVADDKNTNATATKGNVIYAFMSPGADARGAYSMEGARLDADQCIGTNCVEGGDGKMMLSMLRQYNTANKTGNKDFTALMTYEASAEAYEWRVGPWSACGCKKPKKTQIGRCEINWQGKPLIVNSVAGPSAPCKKGTTYKATESCCDKPEQTRTVKCYTRGADKVVNDNKCAAKAKPKTTQPCTQFCWSEPQFPACPTGCGHSASIKSANPSSLLCYENNKKSVVFGVCKADNKPVMQKYCPSTGSCPPPDPDTGGGYVDTDGDGKGDTHIRNMPNGSSGASSSTLGGSVDGSSSKDASGNFGGSHDSGDTGHNSVPRN